MPQFTILGTSYEVPDLDDLTTTELREIKKNTGMGLRPLVEGLQDMDPDAIIAVAYVARRRAGEKITWSDLDDLKPLKDIDWPETKVGDDGTITLVDDAAPPTKARSTGNGRVSGSRATSRSSRTTSTSPPATSTSSP